MNIIPHRKHKEGGEPLHPVKLFRRQMDRLFEDFWGESGLLGRLAAGQGRFLPRVDVAETDQEVVVTAELPGLAEKDVEVSLAHGQLVLSGQKQSEREEKDKSYHLVERSCGSFKRVVELPGALQEDQAAAAFKNGILTVKVPKSAAVKARKIQIQGG